MANSKILLPVIFILALQYACVKPEDNPSADLAINELLPVNKTIVADQDGEYDDWIELYNLSSADRDISGFFLSDNKDHFSKWQFPSGATVPGNGYLIIWADEDSTQAGLHANFKLSSQGEEVLLSGSDGTLLDKVIFPGQTLELSFSRNPDGTGSFKWQTPTFNSSNNVMK